MSVAHRVRQRFLEYSERGSRGLGVDGIGDARGDRHRHAGNHGHSPRFVLDGTPKVAVIEAGRPQPRGDATNHRDAEVDLADGGLQPIDDVTGRFQFVQPPRGAREIELDAGEQLTQFVVQLAGNPRPFFLAHLLEAFGECGVESGFGEERELQPGCTFNTAIGFLEYLSEFV
jgi:hypothetical protein